MRDDGAVYVLDTGNSKCAVANNGYMATLFTDGSGSALDRIVGE